MQDLFLASKHQGAELFPEGVEVRAGLDAGLDAGGCGLFLGTGPGLEEFGYPPGAGSAEFGAGGGGWVEIWERKGEGDCEVDVEGSGAREGEGEMVVGGEGDLGDHG